MDVTSQNMIYEINIDNNETTFVSFIETALNNANDEIGALDETISTIHGLKSECDKLDYALAASSGLLCGILDIFLVGKPQETPLGNITDKWFEERTMDFAKKCGWSENGDSSSAIRFLENKFKIPYDQRGAGDAASFVFDLSPTNHHFKSLAHNPTLLGLFFSILDQFNNSSHFVSGGDLISLEDADNKFELRGKSIPGKLFCAFVNWFGHLISDMSGSSSSKSRGMGIPSPIWSWTNNVIAIKRSLNIPASEFDKSVNELAINLYNEGYDARFQAAQAIPVFINELVVRLIYSLRRLIKYFSETDKQNRSFKLMWRKCEPFKNSTVKRMLTVAHGTFVLVDSGEAVIRSFISGGGTFNPVEFFMRLNIIGIGRFAISLFGELNRSVKLYGVERNILFAKREKVIIKNYIENLHLLSKIYDDKEFVNLGDDLNEGMFLVAFEKSVKLAELRNVSQENIVRNKNDIDNYFKGGKK